MATSSSRMARTSIVPVTARPSGVVLKYCRPPERIWKAPQVRAARPSSTRAALQSTSRDSSAPYSPARPGTEAISGSSYWPISAVYVYGIAPLSRIQATATEVSRPPEKAIPTRWPTGREVRTFDTGLTLVADPLAFPEAKLCPGRQTCTRYSADNAHYVNSPNAPAAPVCHLTLNYLNIY